MTVGKGLASIATFSMLALAAQGLLAQNKVAQFSVFSDYSQAEFKVDGQPYYGKATFMWPEGSRHVLEFPMDEGYQFTAGGATRFRFEGWEDHNGLLPNGDNPVQVVVANASLKSYKLNLEAAYRVKVIFWKSDAAGGNGAAPAACGPPDNTAVTTFRPGVVLIGDTCIWRDSEQWLTDGTYLLGAYPYPGFAFTGWGIGDAGPNAFLRTLDVRGPMVVAAYFQPAKRVKFVTEPPGLKVLLDRTTTPTPVIQPCGENQSLPLGAPPGIPPMCIGEVDWALNTRHAIGAPTPQTDSTGRLWVFHSFSNGSANNSLYEVVSLEPETIVAKFVPGAQVSFLTAPTGLKLVVNGRDNWPSYNFVAAAGDRYTLSAPAQQVGSDGRFYVFRGWSNGGEATQEITIPAEAAQGGLRLTATYEMLSQTLISTEPAGTPVEVDGVTCDTPCAIDRPDGTEVRVSVPVRRSVSEVNRVEFAAWSDGASRDRTVKIAGKDSVRLTALYTTFYRFVASSQPSEAATFVVSPASPDGYYAKDVTVSVAVTAKDGFRFRRWAGDLEGRYDIGTLQMSVPRAVIAMLDEVPYNAPATVRNAAGVTPNEEVAPGSIISIYGTSLASSLQIGQQNPLPQTLGGVTVEVASRLLALLFVSAEQINAVLPYDLPEGNHTLTIRRDGLPNVTGEFKVMRNSPGLFSRVFDTRAFVMAAHEDGSPITLESPAQRGETIRLYGTGFGMYDKVAPYGFNLPEAPAFTLADPMDLLIAGEPAKCEWVGGAGGFSGADAVKLLIREELPASTSVELKVRINGRESNQLLLPVKYAGLSPEDPASGTTELVSPSEICALVLTANGLSFDRLLSVPIH